MCQSAQRWQNWATLECPDLISNHPNHLFRIFFTLARQSSGMHTWTKVTSLSVSARTGNRFEFKFTNSRKSWGGRFEYQPNPPQRPPLVGFRDYWHTKLSLLLAAHTTACLTAWVVPVAQRRCMAATTPPWEALGTSRAWLVAMDGMGWPPRVGKGLFRVIC